MGRSFVTMNKNGVKPRFNCVCLLECVAVAMETHQTGPRLLAVMHESYYKLLASTALW